MPLNASNIVNYADSYKTVSMSFTTSTSIALNKSNNQLDLTISQ